MVPSLFESLKLYCMELLRGTLSTTGALYQYDLVNSLYDRNVPVHLCTEP